MTDSVYEAPEPEKVPSSGNLSILTNIFTTPAKAMEQVQQRYNVVFSSINDDHPFSNSMVCLLRNGRL